jgi:beta-lactamase regulating signal transducer with metallopeptidase domain
MNWLAMQSVAEISVERIVNALPEGLLIAFFAWVLLRVLRKQNSGTRFAVWFLTLMTVATLPLFGSFIESFKGVRLIPGISSGMSWASLRPAITISSHWALFVFVVWVLGASVAMVRLLAGLWHLRKLRGSCTPIVVEDLDPLVWKTVEIIRVWKSASKSAAKAITVATSEQVRVPAAIGLWDRTIVLPAWALRELPANDLNAILLHEFAHLRRGDDWTNLIQKIVRALFFFHPAVWWIENRLSVEREMACDDAVLAETANPRGYASCLVSLLEKSLAQRGWSMAQAAVHRAHEASLRLAQILDTNRPVATRVWKPALGMVGVFSMVCLMVLPHAPEFVAFDRGTLSNPATHSASVYSAALGNASVSTSFGPSSVGSSSVKTATVIPASFRVSESMSRSSLQTSAKAFSARIPAHAVAARQLVPVRTLIARSNATPPREQFVVSASANQKIVPEFQTLVFIEATQYVADDSSVWSVQVWRVTLLTTELNRLAKVPVANSI